MAKKQVKTVSSFSKICSKFLVLVVFTLVCMIFLKSNAGLRDKVYKKAFQNNFSFAKLNETYKKYFGSSVPLSNEKKDSSLVSSTKLEYSDAEKYKDGVKLVVKEDYLVSSLDSGLIIFVGEKEGYGNTIIVQRSDNVEVWYANIKNVNVSLYDYIKKGSNLGEANGNNIYLVFTKEGKVENYQKYL
ncbi:MAG: M23 family metallopeptidase [Bacilli bacterium]|nr:M23 family metallopeptidase [Bacilli bacterium]